MLYLFLGLFLFCFGWIVLLLKKNYLIIFINMAVMINACLFIFYLFLKKSNYPLPNYNFILLVTFSMAQFVIGLTLLSKYFRVEKTIDLKE